MTCRGNWVCFNCRVSVRKLTGSGITANIPETLGMRRHVCCHLCQESMRFIGPSIKVPPKNKKKEWEKLETWLLQFRRDHFFEKERQNTARRHRIEKRIEELKSRPENSERNRLIKEAEQALLEVGEDHPIEDRHFPEQ